MLTVHAIHLFSVSTSSLNISKSQSRLLSSISEISCGPRKFFTCTRELTGDVIALMVDNLAESDDDLLDSHAVRGDCQSNDNKKYRWKKKSRADICVIYARCEFIIFFIRNEEWQNSYSK